MLAVERSHGVVGSESDRLEQGVVVSKSDRSPQI